MKKSKTQARVERIFAEACAGIRVPAGAVRVVMSKGLLLALYGLDDGEIGAGMIQEARDAANALSVARVAGQ